MVCDPRAGNPMTGQDHFRLWLISDRRGAERIVSGRAKIPAGPTSPMDASIQPPAHAGKAGSGLYAGKTCVYVVRS